MRKVPLFIAVIIGIAGGVGCKKGSDSPPGYFMSAKIDTATFDVGLCTASIGNNSFALLAADGSAYGSSTYPQIGVYVLSGYTGPGTYALDSNSFYATAIRNSVTFLLVAHGTVTITASKPLTGTFSFTCRDSTKVTNGSFSAKTN